jgi:autotransporter-associated beta strand protein
VTIYGNGLSFSGANNMICRFIRVREGINGDSGTDAIGVANGHDMVFDHLSDSWGRDETFSCNGAGLITNITIQSCIIAQGLQTHSAGGLIQTDGGVSILRCLYIDNDTRNPKVKFKNEFVNNVVANWETIGYNMGGDSAGDSYANAFNNYFIKGPNSSSSAFGGGNANFHIYATNNWVDGNHDGVLNGSEWAIANYGPMDLQAVPFDYPITNAMPPLTALKFAISDVGMSQRRDSVDERLMTEVLSGGVLGETISSEYGAPMSGPGVIRNGPTPLDTDQDGMPDYWENGTGSNPGVANNNAASPSGSGYTRLEDYLNWLAEPHGIALTTNVDVELRQFTRGFTNYNPVFSVANATNGTVSLSANGLRARFVPTPGYTGPASFNFTVTDSDGSTVTRQMNLFFTPAVTNTSLIWRGDALTNNWNALGDLNWFDGYSLLFPFHNGDTVTFDDTGFNSPNVNLAGSLTPASVTVNAAQNYTFAGIGSLDSSFTLNKSGSGTLTLANTNNGFGSVTVSNGTLLVDGSLSQSTVTVRSGATVGGSGRFGSAVALDSGASLAPGHGIGSPGLLTITNGLALWGGVNLRFDLSDDPTGTVKTNDQINIINGNLLLSGTNTIVVTLLNGPLANGDYVLITYTGGAIGSLASLTVIGANGTLTSAAGQILLHVDNTRASASLVWLGGFSANTWDTGTNANWLNGTNQDRFYFGDTVLFDNSGSTNPAVNLIGALTPAALTVDSTNNYTFSGTGKISGTGVFTKTNSGTLTITTTNDFTGRVIIGGSGVFAVSRLANGGAASGIGASSSDATNLVFYGGTLRYTGSSVATDKSATLNRNATIDVVSGTLTANGPLTGSGALIKAGAGTLAIPTNNTHSGGTIISNGTVNLTTTYARDSGLGTGTTTLAGGTLQLFGYGGSTGTDFGTFNRPLNVIFGTTNALLTPPRYTMSSTLTGSGTLNLTVDYVRGALSGNWSAFAGTINVTGRIAASEFRVSSTSGFSNATVFITDNVVITRSGSGIPIQFGALGGTSGSQVGPGNSTSSGNSYTIGGNNADATFAGTLKADGVNTFTKIGTGRWTLTGANTYSGGTVINGGIILANNTSGSATGSAAVTVNTNGALGGTGSVSGTVTVNSGGAISPGSNGVGTVTFTGGLTLNSGAILNFEIGTTNDKVAVTGALVLGGTLNVTNLAGFGAGTYPLITYSGALSGVLPVIGSKPSGYSCTVNTNTANQVRLVVQVQTPPVFGNIVLTNGSAIFSGTGGPTNVPYFVLNSTNLALPLANWTRLATNQFNAAGGFIFTNPVSPGSPQQFLILQLP